MITEKDLQEAIAECHGVRNPNAQTCIMLAAYYTILDHIRTQTEPPVDGYSFDAGEPVENYIEYYSDTEFSQAINGLRSADVWPVIDELMTTLQALNPRLYAGVMRRIAG